MSAHTKEPWFFVESQLGATWTIQTVEGGGGVPIAIQYGNGENSFADGRRIVACVNACAGVDTETLEQGISIGLVRQVHRTISAEKQRDQLLAALIAIVADDAHGFPVAAMSSHLRNAARAAIAAAKGEQA